MSGLLGILVVFLCYCTAQLAAVPGDCDFENGSLCGYVQDTKDHFDWSAQINGTRSPGTGPEKDHTTGLGTYMYIETSWPRISKMRAVLISPTISNTNGKCLAFYYHMKGLNIQTLNVYTQESTGSRTLQWSLSGDQFCTDWSIAKFPLSTSRKNIKIVFEGVSGTGYRGDIAIDDIKVYDTPFCFVLPFKARPTPGLNLLTCGNKPISTRIVGGKETVPGAWPWQAMLMYINSHKQWTQFCGGTLVTPEWVVTASHCVNTIAPDEYKDYQIRLGAHYVNQTTGVEQDFQIERIYMHPDYNAYPYELDNDIALIKLKRPALLNNRVNLACLPNNRVQFPVGTRCYITGWGTLKAGGDSPWKLQEATVPLVSTAECTKNGSYEATHISPRMLCAGFPGVGGVDSCQGDSGGPLVCENNSKWYLVGVTSWGYSCADAKYPGVYARVDVLKQWLARTMANHIWGSI